MKRYCYYLSCDSDLLELKLNELANKGLELVDFSGVFWGQFIETLRKDTLYCVVRCRNDQAAIAQLETYNIGWILVGFMNDMAIYKSRPCMRADRDSLIDLLNTNKLVNSSNHVVILIRLCVIAFILIDSWFGVSKFDMYSNLSIVSFALLITNIVFFIMCIPRRKKPAAICRGISVHMLYLNFLVLISGYTIDYSNSLVFEVIICVLLSTVTLIVYRRNLSTQVFYCIVAILLVFCCFQNHCVSYHQPLNSNLHIFGEFNDDDDIYQFVESSDFKDLISISISKHGSILAQEENYDYEYVDGFLYMTKKHYSVMPLFIRELSAEDGKIYDEQYYSIIDRDSKTITFIREMHLN